MMKERKEPYIGFDKTCLLLCNNALDKFECHFSDSTSFLFQQKQSLGRRFGQ